MSPGLKQRSPAQAWLRALELTAPIATDRARTLPVVVQEMAARTGEAPALLSDRICFSYAELAARANQYTRWAAGLGLEPGDVLCLLMSNQPEYLAAWLGLIHAGVIVALLNTNLRGAALAHSISAVRPRWILVEDRFAEALDGALGGLEEVPEITCYGSRVGGEELGLAAAEWLDLDGISAEPLGYAERAVTTLEQTALYIYTSGTTGLPKAARVSHARLMQWSHWFAGMMQAQRSDRLYNCLPMYHSVGGVQAPGAMLAVGGSVVLRDRFSASAFWPDVERWQCTIFQYIGELCRYLLHSLPVAAEPQHRLRLACGNGLSGEVWSSFQQRFAIPQILEFYASTEGNVSLFNAEGRPGAIGRVPPWLAHRFSPELVRVDPEAGEPVHGDDGFCLRCEPNEVGEALGRMNADNVGSRFDGYTSGQASARKVLRDVFESGDAWFRTGDLMRKDSEGFYHFVDRMGDTFRRKGENVATLEVAEAIARFQGVAHAVVYGVTVPQVEGRIGMAAIVAEEGLDLERFRQHLSSALPEYARPAFLRLQSAAEVTGTWKYSKAELVRAGYHPGWNSDALFVAASAKAPFVTLDEPVYEAIQAGHIRF